ncbi:MAG: YehR family protein [Candidatus Saccharibacteria bacterium]|nr:YehR family protein [Candidatus Saccharibacteria bacterium]
MNKTEVNRKKTIIASIIGGVIVILAVVLCFIGFSNREQVVTYERTEDGITMSLTYYAKGDRVYKQTANNIIPYSVLGIETATEAESILSAYFSSELEKSQGIVGYSDEIEYTDDAVIETVVVDYDIVNLDEVKDLMGAYFSGDIDSEMNNVSLKRSGEYLESQGFIKK